MKIKNYIILIVIIIIDQISKFLVIDKFIEVIPNIFSITYTQNFGVAFGIGNGILILVLNIVIVALFITYIILKRKEIKDFTLYFIVLGGAFGNLIDRIFRGYVIDFIDVKLFNFPNFNVADICITLGIIFILLKKIFLILKKKKQYDNITT